MWRTVNDMYKYINQTGGVLLSEYVADFWENYKNNHVRYDKMFNRFYYSYRYMLQECDEDISVITNNFSEDVYNHLMINNKKYSELYRVNVVDDEKYSILNNYDVFETMSKKNHEENQMKYGTREDSVNSTLGSRTDSTVLGAQSNTETSKIAGFNSTDFSNADTVTNSIGSRTDNNSIGEQKNVSSSVKGEQNDTDNTDGTEEYELTRVGNIGVKTATEIMREHKNFWSMWDFYKYIFSDICAELLLV